MATLTITIDEKTEAGLKQLSAYEGIDASRLAAEAQSAAAYWTDVDRSQSVYDGYGHQIVSLNWGGKRDYGTWFSAEPAAILAWPAQIAGVPDMLRQRDRRR